MKKILLIILVGIVIMLKPINAILKDSLGNIILRGTVVTGIIATDNGDGSYDVFISEAEEARKNMMFEAELEIQKEASFSQIRIQEELAKAQIIGEKEGMKLANERYIAQINAIASQSLNKFKEDEKTKRQDRNNSQQSELIAQRKNDGAPINFEADSKFSDLLKSINSNIQ